MTTTNRDIKCETCGNSGAADMIAVWHPFRHPVNVGGSVSASQTFGKTSPDRIGGSASPVTTPESQVTVQAMPFDPVLRQALMDKGVLTPEDLHNAEAKIRVVTGQFQEIMTNEGRPT